MYFEDVCCFHITLLFEMLFLYNYIVICYFTTMYDYTLIIWEINLNILTYLLLTFSQYLKQIKYKMLVLLQILYKYSYRTPPHPFDRTSIAPSFMRHPYLLLNKAHIVETLKEKYHMRSKKEILKLIQKKPREIQNNQKWR